MSNKLGNKLRQRKEEGTYRSLSLFKGKIDFWSNDYLGYGKLDMPKSDHLLHSGTGSRLISGTSSMALSAEEKCASYFKSEAALIFNSGYDANLGFFSSIPQKGDLVLYDQYCHASIRDGLRLSFAKSIGFEHNNLASLRSKLSLKADEKYVVIESLYSMEGDFSSLKKIVDLCSEFDAKLIVDEAHSGGVFGEEGEGYCAALGLEKNVFARIITFGKAFGSHGAVVLSDQQTKEFLINFARSFIYTTALPESAYERITKILAYRSEDRPQIQLMENISCFRRELEGIETILPSAINSPIQIVLCQRDKALNLSKHLIDEGFAVKSILYPTVPKEREGLRVCIHNFNTKSQIKGLTHAIKQYVMS